jgi:hypothetical protein
MLEGKRNRSIYSIESPTRCTWIVCILYFTMFALHVSGAVYIHHQEHKLQSTSTGMRDCYGVLDSPLEQVLASLRLYSAVCAPDDGYK